jgi:hypothetical protein
MNVGQATIETTLRLYGHVTPRMSGAVTDGGEQSLRSRVERPSRGMLARRVTRPSAALTESTVIAQRPAAQCAGPQVHAGSAPGVV